jgi:hypothetical protein
MALTRISSIVVDPSTLTKAYLNDFKSPTLSEDDGWLIFSILIHQAVNKRSADFEGVDPAVFGCNEFLYNDKRVFEWIKQQKKKNKYYFDSTLIALGLTILFYKSMTGSTFSLNNAFHERVKSMDVLAILEMFKPTTSLTTGVLHLRSDLTDSETSFDSNDSNDSMEVAVQLCENCAELPEIAIACTHCNPSSASSVHELESRTIYILKKKSAQRSLQAGFLLIS